MKQSYRERLGCWGVKAYNLYNRRVYPVQSCNKQDGERQVRKQKASRVVAGAVEAFCEIQCVMVIVECAGRGKSVRGILDDRINTLRRGSNSKRLYDRYRSERGRNESGEWCNTVSCGVPEIRRNRAKRSSGPRVECPNLETEVYNP